MPVRAQAPLVVGAVRDQRGSPIAGAVGRGRVERASQCDDGCGRDIRAPRRRDCLGPRHLPLLPRSGRRGEARTSRSSPIVQRYDALADDRSIAERSGEPPLCARRIGGGACARSPCCNRASTPYPGSRLSDRGLSSSGSLLSKRGCRTTTSSTAESPYELVPAQFTNKAPRSRREQRVSLRRPGRRRHLTADPFGSGASRQVATIGSDAIARGQVGIR